MTGIDRDSMVERLETLAPAPMGEELAMLDLDTGKYLVIDRLGTIFEGPGDLAARLEWLHEDRRRAEQLGRTAYDWARRDRSPERLSAQRTGFYEALVRDRVDRREVPAGGGPGFEETVDGSPLARLRRSHRSWERPIDYFRAMLDQQPYDYVALRTVIAHAEENPAEAAGLDRLYGRLCLLAPEAVPADRRPAGLRDFLPA